jgi:PhnB protein
MSYTDIFVVPVSKQNVAAYRKEAEEFFSVWREHGALSCVEIEGDDVPVGKVTSFPRSVALKDGESVFVGLTTYKSRAHRDEVNERAMKDPRMAGMDPKKMSFDASRMFFGGFKPFLGQSTAQASIQPYLFFRGRCEEAIEYYKSKLGAEVGMMMRFKDNPEKPSSGKVSAELDDKIMHAALHIHGATIMMSDGMRSGPVDFDCMSLSLTVSNEADVDRIFNSLAADGKIQMPLCSTFFAKRFGGVADKFGVTWMIIVPA